MSRTPIPLEEILKDQITDETKIPDVEPVVFIRDSIFAVKGDFSIIGGKPKVGKTTVVAFMIATALMETVPEGFDSLGIRSKYCEGRKVIYVDTEMPRSSTEKLRKLVLKLLGVSKQPENLIILNLRSHNLDDKKNRIYDLMDQITDCHLWIIDGIGDLIRDVNNPEQSNEAFEHFLVYSQKRETTMILHLHENPGLNTGSKLRGNLGSEGERRAGSVISITKDSDRRIHTIKCRILRYSEDFEPIPFEFSRELGRPVSLEGKQLEDYKRTSDPEVIKKENRHRLATRCLLNGSNHIGYKEFINRILLYAGEVEGKAFTSKSTADARLLEMQKLKIVAKDNTGLYSMVQKPQNG